MNTINYSVFISFLLSLSTFSIAQEDRPPNVILVITDDQGYGDLGCHGNSVIKTPNLDAFYKKSLRLTDFHVGPTCSPTRAGLLTGRSANRTGVWHTIGGCSILREDEITMAQLFRDEGYETGMFGKWHLGDTYPSRPTDKGFKHAVYHGGGGVGQTPDFWKNDYFDDTYFVNNTPKKFSGYCTDIWFDEALNYIESVKDNPFFCYISTNAPHGPFNVPEEYYKKYANLDIPERQKRFYGMISNIDDNFGKLYLALQDNDLLENTIVIFMSDNGTAAGFQNVEGNMIGHNAGMRGTKGSEYEGGHRVPFFFSLPALVEQGGRDIDILAGNVDVLPTLAHICGLSLPDRTLDGIDISGVLLGTKRQVSRPYLITDSQRIQAPIKWRKSAVMSAKWRLVNGEELYNIKDDPGQKLDLAAEFPERVSNMRNYYEEWWTSVSENFSDYPTINVGSDRQNPVVVTCHDVHESGGIPWNQNYIRAGEINPDDGNYTIKFEQSGKYQISIARWPFEANLGINDPADQGQEATAYSSTVLPGKALNFVSGGIKIGGWKSEALVEDGNTNLLFEGEISAGIKNVEAWFTTPDQEKWGAYYLRFLLLD